MDTAEGSLSNSSTSTSLDTVVIESAKDSTLLPPTHPRTTFSPILESEDGDTITSPTKAFESPKISNLKKTAQTAASKPSLKGSKVSFEQPGHESDDSFEDRREHFQQKKSLSATDRKGILKVSNSVNATLTID